MSQMEIEVRLPAVNRTGWSGASSGHMAMRPCHGMGEEVELASSGGGATILNTTWSRLDGSR